MAAVLVVSRYPSVRLGLRAMLESNSGIHVVADAADIKDIPADGVDVILLDYDEDLFDALMRETPSHTPLLIVGGTPDLASCLSSLPISGWGLVRRDAAAEAIAAACQAVAQGYVVLEPHSLKQIGKPIFSHELQPLTERERQVLQLVGEGLANKEIAKQLSISIHTAKFHVAAILEKLSASSRAEAVSIGIRNGAVHL